MNNRIKNIIKVIAFLLIVAMVFTYVTNLYRSSTDVAGVDRTHVVAIDNEENLDVVYLGGSACFMFFQPLNAWNEYGFTSYDYAVTGIEGAAMEYMIRHVESKMDPDLYVVGVRPYEQWTLEGNIGGLREVSDSMSVWSVNRLKLIKSYFEKHDLSGVNVDIDYASYIFDIVNYHDNSDVIKTRENWQFKQEHDYSPNKGFEWLASYQHLDTPTGWQTDKRAELLEGDEAAIRELCEFCRSKNKEVLFVVCPYYIEESHQEYFNSISDIVTEYGYNFLNANEHYDEIGTDFAKDYYNRRHTNAYGAEKYTKYLSKYIKDNYDIKDHRGEKKYEYWNDEYVRFAEEEKEQKRLVDEIIESDLKGYEMADELKKIDNLLEWYRYTNTDRYTLFIYDNSTSNYVNLHDLSIIVDNWGINSEEKQCYKIVNGDEISIESVSLSDNDSTMEGIVAKDGMTNYSISSGKMVISGNDYYEDVDGFCVVAVDNNLNIVADNIIIDASGSEAIIRR